MNVASEWLQGGLHDYQRGSFGEARQNSHRYGVEFSSAITMLLMVDPTVEEPYRKVNAELEKCMEVQERILGFDVDEAKPAPIPLIHTVFSKGTKLKPYALEWEAQMNRFSASFDDFRRAVGERHQRHLRVITWMGYGVIGLLAVTLAVALWIAASGLVSRNPATSSSVVPISQPAEVETSSPTTD